MIKLDLYKAQSTGDREAPSHVITIDEELPDLPKAVGALPEAEWYQRVAKRFEREATELDAALHDSLPGGTYDALFAVMAKRKASVLFVAS